MFYLTIVNKILRHCHSWLARQYISKNYKILGCVRSYANSTIGLPITFGVQPLVTLAYHWLPTGFTLASIFCRRSRAWVKRFTRKNYVIKIEDLKSLSAETSGVITIIPIQMTINKFLMTGETMKYISASKLLCYSCFPLHPRFEDRIWASKLVS